MTSAADDVINAAPPVEILEGMAWAGGLTVLVSESGAGKTFVLLDASAAVSSGVAWRGRGSQQGSLAAMGAVHRPADGCRKGAISEERGPRRRQAAGARAHSRAESAPSRRP